eukprot:TRINITY_DN2102_c0_g1_i2.p1 TRINITY_DN2102_c0_g1~~TRINITY_DN2102_c0_g1_i2.p1  ORF type:complete len:116 (-),score=33.90 TRINITY_DN2102_c0_g1_i2:273-620(-)
MTTMSTNPLLQPPPQTPHHHDDHHHHHPQSNPIMSKPNPHKFLTEAQIPQTRLQAMNKAGSGLLVFGLTVGLIAWTSYAGQDHVFSPIQKWASETTDKFWNLPVSNSKPPTEQEE